MLTAADLLAGADGVRDVEVPADLLGGLAAPPADRRVRLQPLTVNDLRLVARAALGRWIGLAIGVSGVVIPAAAMASALAGALPAAVSPLLAATGALASVLIVAVLVRRAA